MLKATYPSLVIEADQKVITVAIDRPEALNAITETVMDSLSQVFMDLEDDKQYTGLIITGVGDKAFAAGADIKQFSFENDAAVLLSRKGHDTFNRIENFHLPVIAAINGFALGGGCELAMSCHLRIASREAKFGQPEVSLGLIPGYGGTQRLPQLIGKAKALELLLTGDLISANEALSLGLINAVVEPGDEISTAKKWLDKIGSKAPLAVQKIIRLVNQHYANPSDAFLQESEDFGASFQTADAREGIQAFLEKRKPKFMGK